MRVGGGLKKPDSSPPTTSLGFGILPSDKPSDRRGRAEKPTPKRAARILVVDEDPAVRRLMVTRLGAANYAVEAVGDAQAALDACGLHRPNLVIIELHRSDEAGGLGLLKEIKSRWPNLAVIVLTSHGTIPEAVQATQSGAFSYLVKPVAKDELLGHVQRATAMASPVLNESEWQANILARSVLMQDRLGVANRAASTDEPVLLTGEYGTGKELLARAIHAASARRRMPFVTFSCRRGGDRSLATELFGDHGAEAEVPGSPQGGALQSARGGTLLMEEIGELPLELQSKLASVLANSSASTSAARLICTTSRDLRGLTDSGAFLLNLYYQINILPIEIPPLGRRREDIPLLVSHFLEQATEAGTQSKIYSPEAIELLATTDWPGNVRQLFDAVKQNVKLSHGKVMTREFVQQSLNERPAKIPTYAEARDQFSRNYLAENLQRTSGNVTQAARLAKRSRTDFYKLLARYRLHPDDFKTPPSEGEDESEGEEH
jgi:two-component system response regulator GlrR